MDIQKIKDLWACAWRIAAISILLVMGIQGYAKAKSPDYTKDFTYFELADIDPYESIREQIRRQALRDAEEATRRQAVEIEKMYQQMPDIEKMRGDAEVK